MFTTLQNEVGQSVGDTILPTLEDHKCITSHTIGMVCNACYRASLVSPKVAYVLAKKLNTLAKTTANGQLARKFSACVRGSNSSYQQVGKNDSTDSSC